VGLVPARSVLPSAQLHSASSLGFSTNLVLHVGGQKTGEVEIEMTPSIAPRPNEFFELHVLF
jgi:hypothetical protein